MITTTNPPTSSLLFNAPMTTPTNNTTPTTKTKRELDVAQLRLLRRQRFKSRPTSQTTTTTHTTMTTTNTNSPTDETLWAEPAEVPSDLSTPNSSLTLWAATAETPSLTTPPQPRAEYTDRTNTPLLHNPILGYRNPLTPNRPTNSLTPLSISPITMYATPNTRNSYHTPNPSNDPSPQLPNILTPLQNTFVMYPNPDFNTNPLNPYTQYSPDSYVCTRNPNFLYVTPPKFKPL